MSLLCRIYKKAGGTWEKGIFVHGSHVTTDFKGRAMGNDGNRKSDCKAMVKECRGSLMIDYEERFHELK